MKSDAHVTTEKTAKKFKVWILISTLGIIGSIGWFIAALSSEDPASTAGAVLLFVVSLVVRIITKVLIWWNHG